MGLFSKGKTKPVSSVEFDMLAVDRIYRYRIIGCGYATDDGPSGDALIKEITGGKDGWYEGTLKPCTYKLKPAVKACLKNSKGKYIHVGWIPKEKAKSVMEMTIRDKGKVIFECDYNETADANILVAHIYWE